MGKNVIISTLPNISQNYLPKVNTSNIFANSLVYDDGSSVLINTTTASAFRLDVNGTGRFQGALTGTSATFTSSTYPNLITNRSQTSVGSGSATWAALQVKVTTTEQMSAGFGVAQEFVLRDADNTDNINAQFLVQRDGADNSGKFILQTASSGTLGDRLTISSTGAASFSSSVTAGSLIKSTNAGAGFRHFYNNGSGNIEVSQRSDNKLQIYAYSGTAYTDILLGVDGSTTGGNVGIGTTSPSNKLHVSDSTNSTTAIFENPGGSTQYIGLKNTSGTVYIGNVSNYLYFETGNTERMRIENAYSVRFTSNNASAATFDLNYRFSTPDSARIRFSTTTAYNQNEPGELSFWTRANDAQGAGSITERMRITSGGIVEFTEYTRARLYQIYANGLFRGGLYNYVNASGGGTDYSPSLVSETALYFCVNGNATKAMTITSGGKVNINDTSNTTYQLYVNGSVYSTSYYLPATAASLQTTDAGAYVSLFGATGGGGITNTLIFGTNNTERMRILSDGNIRIGTTTDSYGRVTVNYSDTNNNGIAIKETTGAANSYLMLFISNATTRGTIQVNSTATGVNYNATSDYRLKEDLKNYNGIDIVNRIKTYDFKWKNTDVRSYGVLAHELQEVFPDIVGGLKDAVDKNGEIIPQGVDYGKLTPILVKAIQELNQKITLLENK